MTLTEERTGTKHASPHSASSRQGTDLLPPVSAPEDKEARRTPSPVERPPDERHLLHWLEWIGGLVALALVVFGVMQFIGSDSDSVDNPPGFDPGQNLVTTVEIQNPNEFDPGMNQVAPVARPGFDPGMNQTPARAEFDPGMNRTPARAEFDPGQNR